MHTSVPRPAKDASLTMLTDNKLLSLRELADYLAVNEASIYRWRRTGDGPPGIKLARGAIRYRAVDVEAWLDAQADQPRQPVD